MNTLTEKVKENQAITRPASPCSIVALQAALGFSLSEEYQAFLSSFGVIVHGGSETYGLGVPDDYYLHVLNGYKDLVDDPSYPPNSLPLLALGDGRYYLYDNQSQEILLWATPNGGIVRRLTDSLESFLTKQIFG